MATRTVTRAANLAGAEPLAAAHAAGLHYVNDSDPGITRTKQGSGFRYVGVGGRRIDVATLARIQRLAIPPAWTSVWICPDPLGHIQATGRDARQRKQYLYHADWRAIRDDNKYARMLAFGRVLPRLRRQVARDVTRPGLGREKVLATMVCLLEHTLIRVGNEDYARENQSFGLSTMLDRHVKYARGRLEFSFKGKSGLHHHITLDDPRLAQLVRRVQELPGQQLFQFVDGTGRIRDIKSEDLNAYLRRIAGEDFSAKDFRTWAGTVLAAAALCSCEGGAGKTRARRNIRNAIAEAARKLGNTPAICRKSYIHPIVLDTYLRDGCLGPPARRGPAEPAVAWKKAETLVLRLLQQQRRANPRRDLVTALRRSLARRRPAPGRRGGAGGARAGARSPGRR